MKAAIPILVGSLLLGTTVNAADTVTVQGPITSRDNEGMYVRNSDGQFEIEWKDKTRVALEFNTRLFSRLKGNTLHYKVHFSNQIIKFHLPKGPITGIVRLHGARRVVEALNVTEEENWIPEFGLRLRLGEKLPEQLPTAEDPRFVGLWDPNTKPRTLTINGKQYEVSLKKSGQTSALLFNVIGVKDCKPFVNRARLVGYQHGDVILAEEIHVLPFGDQAALDDPKLPRYLFIGDSISSNYNNGLHKALAGKFNLHHPPTNCGPSGKGKNTIVEWLGAHQQKGRHGDVISFNFGHWDADTDKVNYQENLEAVIGELKKTKAKLNWVTTSPVPKGFPPSGGLNKDGKAPKRTSGVMEKYLNPWALEVMKRHPEISICDQWQYVKDNKAGVYKKFWSSKNVHFGGEPADKLGEFLAAHLLKLMKGK